MDKQQLIDYLNRKYEALEFREGLIDVVPWYENLRRIKAEIAEAEGKLNKIREVKNLNIRLNKLSLKNFKGCKLFVLDVEGKNASIFADNGKGKTTLFDGFKYLLFGKDSADRSKFKIKPQDENGNEVHYLQTEVEAELFIDEKPLKLRKMLEEKWTTKRGSTEKELTGNTISYWWDDEPVKEGEYIQRVNALVNEKIFMAVTDPMYFNGQDWKERRTILLTMCGDVDESEILATEKFAKLLETLSGKTVEVYKKILADKLSRLEKERKDIPSRIDELTQSMPELSDDYTAIDLEIERLKAILVEIDGELVAANNSAADYRKKQQELFRQKTDLQGLKTKLDSTANSGTKTIIDEKSKLENEKYELESQITTLKSRLGNGDVAIAAKNKQRDSSITVWKALKIELTEAKAIQFIEPEEGSFNCPTCGQGLPEESRESKLNDMKHRFEAVKDSVIKTVEDKITENVNSGTQLKTDIEAAQKLIAELTANCNMQKIKLKDVQTKISAVVIPEGNVTADYNSSKEYCILYDSVLAFEVELNAPIEDLTADLLRSKRETQNKIDNCNSVIGSKDVAEKSKKRIDELKSEEKRLANEITALKGQEYLIQEFTVAKINS